MLDQDGMEWLARTDQVRVRINTLRPGEGTPWHLHTFVTDNVFCLERGLEIGLREPDETVSPEPGQRQEVHPGRIHRVVNTSAHPLRYLLIQATGQYDFREVP